MPSAGFNCDAQLRDVPVPEGLLGRLRRVALADREDLDAAIRDVPVPAGLVERLWESGLTGSEGLDASIRDIAVPRDLVGRLQRVPRNRARLARLSQWAAAASLLVAIGLSYFGAMVAFLIAVYPNSGDLSQLTQGSARIVEFSNQSGQAEPSFGVAISSGGSRPEGDALGDRPAPVSDLKLIDLEGPERSTMAGLSGLFEGVAGTEMLWDTALDDWGTVIAHQPLDDLPELKLVAGLIPRGIDWPLVPGCNRHILINYGVHPFVSPAADPRLRSSLVPLGVDASSYELTRRHLEDGKLPPPDVVRTEEFLAAVDYGFSPPKREAMGISIAAGPSPFGDPGMRLMQIGVQARRVGAGSYPPIHLVLAVDVSASMRWGGRLEIIRRELSRLVKRLGPDDRISLVIFSEDAWVVAEGAGRYEQDQLLAVIGSLRAETSTNLGAGLREAYALAEGAAPPPEAAARVVLMTDGLSEFTPGTTEKIEQRLADAAARGIHLEVIDLGQERQPDPRLVRFAQAGGGRVHGATNADQVGWALQEIVTGRSQLIAGDVRLKVTFNPKAVQEYRLLGHEAKTVAGLMPAHPEADFRAGQSATALYEMLLNRGGGSEVATVELRWHEPGRDEEHTLTRSVRRVQFGRLIAEAPLRLQEAALVAETAEILRQSPYALASQDSRSLARVLLLAQQVDARLYQRPTFVEFMSLVEQAEKAKPYRRGQ